MDWEKAFDKVDQTKMIEAIYRLNIPEKMLRILTAFYISPKFRIKDREGMSTFRKQRTGIRQGCPLSPYLFIILMTVLIADVHEELGDTNIEPPDNISESELLYADDTLLMTKDQDSMKNLVHAIEKISAEYNMKLNMDKCFHISMNCAPTIHFRNGQPMAAATQVTYLGGTITNKGCPRTEIQSRLSLV